MSARLVLLVLLATASCGRTSLEVFDTSPTVETDTDGDADGDTDTDTDTDTQLAQLPQVTVPQGSFVMGSPPTEACREPFSSKETAHDVQITYDYAMLTTEVTQAQWLSVSGDFPAAQVVSCDTCPVVNVTWDDAAGFCNALSASEGRATCYGCDSSGCTAVADILTCTGWRLPTEAEWERARRGGTTGSIYTTDVSNCAQDPALTSLGWYIGTTPSAEQNVQPSAQKDANPYGLYDMIGNAWEWCEDWQQVDLGSGSVIDPLLTAVSGFRTSRGGGYSDRAELMRAAMRDSNPPGSRFDYLGFRCVRRL